jgi:anti-sigma B factor antagonist
MRIGERRVGDVTVLEVSGRMTVNDGHGKLKDKVSRLAHQGQKQIVLNMAKVTFVDSSGLGELVACHLSAERNGSAIKIANACNRTQDLLVLTKLITLFDSHPSEQAAVESFAGAGIAG